MAVISEYDLRSYEKVVPRDTDRKFVFVTASSTNKNINFKDIDFINRITKSLRATNPFGGN